MRSKGTDTNINGRGRKAYPEGLLYWLSGKLEELLQWFDNRRKGK